MICSTCGSTLDPGAILCGECGSSVATHAASGSVSPTSSGDTTVLDPSRRAWLPGLAPGRHRRPAPGAPIAPAAQGLVRLAFASGQHAIVTGNGLIGRQPLPDPGETFRHILAVIDPARSLSKTHLEFGFDEGGLWVRDRWSANGSLLIAPAQAPLPLEAGRRYRAKIGSRLLLSSVEMAVERVDGSAGRPVRRPVEG
ncbi:MULTISPECIES: hypothetical protein [unclassified Rathayibacter]|uniref:hypothetical protein n=1 Tax=unclassified Rathayibacter TaxID=2609250 RepID=UPI00188BC0AE|nr:MULTISPECIES: hypothetical protein [unclassified Rathayibacter]MBF4461912.1 hypothetical protein [Rathayibacter sp. VKM Ac-2879]MBF4504045.1 hypothetical protein [Rathayibacter sp. VKM Ac-2878]